MEVIDNFILDEEQISKGELRSTSCKNYARFAEIKLKINDTLNNTIKESKCITCTPV